MKVNFEFREKLQNGLFYSGKEKEEMSQTKNQITKKKHLQIEGLMRICKGQILGVQDEDFKMFESNTSNKCGCTLGSCKNATKAAKLHMQ